MHDRRAVGERAARVGHGGERRDLDLDLIGDVLGLLLARCDHGGDQLADKAHHARGEDRLRHRHIVELVQHRLDRLDRRDVGGGDHICAGRHADAVDATRRDRTSHETNPMRRRQVGGEMALPRHQAPDPRAAGSSGRPRSFRSPWSGRSWRGPLQRAPRHRANEVAPVFRIRLDILDRIDRVGGGLRRGAGRSRARADGRSAPLPLQESAADVLPRRRSRPAARR